MLKEIAIADAYAAGFEFSNKVKIQNYNNLSRYVPHDLYGFEAKYTDDTQMSIAIAELLLGNQAWTPESIASSFVSCFKRDPRKGYSKGFYELLSQISSGAELLEKIKPDSSRNGAAMRSVPLGYLSNKINVIHYATEQAKVTHDTPMGISSSCAVALVAHLGLILNGSVSDISKFLEAEGFSGWDLNWHTEASVEAFDTISAVLTCLQSTRSTKELLWNCVELGGDTDSVSAIAVGLAACFTEYNKDLPGSLFELLDEPVYGLKFLSALDNKLSNKFCK
ncbi:MAG: crystallin J1 [Cellvibrio sp. 79]|nr:MAG: crystallin J1 [Cellvibrio sp. 79]